ncbi:MAG TPA: hypothetical protein VFG59_13980 [Anaeromyxobacter sp.]|nr:hypothetical protein [Anaeromyxobacter sp.]
MTRRALALVALAAAAGCNKGGGSATFRLSEPGSVAVFHGYAAKNVGILHPYAAVANSANDELILFDPVDNIPLDAPLVIRPLAVALPTPRPALLASAAFTPPSGQARRPDLMVVVAAGSTELQLIRTWQSSSDLDPGLSTDATHPDGDMVDLGGEVSALLATPTVNPDGSIQPDAVRVVAALAGGSLAVVDYQWTGDPTTTEGKVSSASPPTTLSPGFDVLSLAVDPGSLPWDPTTGLLTPNGQQRFLYAATLDPISSGIHGVARFDMSGAPGTWTVDALDAHSPTRLVAALTLKERVLDARGGYDQITTLGSSPSSALTTVSESGQASFQQQAVSRVYAFRDPGSCGPDRPLPCGVVVLDPSTGDLMENPWNPGQTPKDYLPPLPAVANPVALLVAVPPRNPPTGDFPDAVTGTNVEGGDYMLMRASGNRVTTGVLVMPEENGQVTYADLARWEVPNAVLELFPAAAETGVTTITQSRADLPRIGFFRPSYLAPPVLTAAIGSDLETVDTAMVFIRVTPGFTPTDVWTVTYQGYLPAFTPLRPADVEAVAGGLQVSFQAHPPGISTPTQVVNVYDPSYGVRLGDIVEIWTHGSAGTGETQQAQGCPDTTLTNSSGLGVSAVEGTVTGFLPPDASHPGGSLLIARGGCVPVATGVTVVCNSDTYGPWDFLPGCWPDAGTPSPELTGPQQVRIRARGFAPGGTSGQEEFVVVGSATGYAGRVTRWSPPAAPDAQTPATFQFRFSNDDESLSCPLFPYPADPASVQVCDGSCRDDCEQAAIARRARRHHLTAVHCYVDDNNCSTYYSKADPANEPDLPAGDPNANDAYLEDFVVRSWDPSAPFEPRYGPALAFSVGIQQSTPPKPFVVRDTQVVFDTRSGYVPVGRYPTGGNGTPPSEPRWGAYFDRTEDPNWGKQEDRYRFYVPYVGNLVVDISPAQSNSDTRVLR